jgi:hypothetical protein
MMSEIEQFVVRGLRANAAVSPQLSGDQRDFAQPGFSSMA